MRRYLLIATRDYRLARELDALPRAGLMHQSDVTHPSHFLNRNVVNCVASTSNLNAAAAAAPTDFDGGEDETSHDRS